jgi:tetratricopeptide (TPR) repeat protein
LAADNPGHLPQLALALSNLGLWLAELGRREEIEDAWKITLDRFPPYAVGVLLLLRSQYSAEGEARAAGWLGQALGSAGDDRELMAAVHYEVRRHRSKSSITFDSAWRDYSGTGIPDWFLVDSGLLATAGDWMATPTYKEEQRYLAAHPELLDRSADLAVEEALLHLQEDEADRYRKLRVTARTDGVEASYRPLLLSILASDFVAAPPDRQEELLRSRRTDLVDPLVADMVADQAADTGEEDWGPERALALLSLAASQTPAFLDEVLTALQNRSRIPEVLRRCADTAEPTALGDVARCAISVAATDEEVGTCVFYLSIAAALHGDLHQAVGTLTEARRLNPEARDSWITILAQLTRPAALALIPRLTAPMPSTPDAPET